MQGKRHQKLKAAAGSLASDDCWVWRPAIEKAASAASAAPAAPMPELLMPRHDLLPALGKTGKAKGQTGKWEKVENIAGDYFARTDSAFLMEDVMDPGDVAPFWERFGHSLSVFAANNISETTGEITNKVNAMVICGGFTPRPDNDVWVSKDGISWFLIGAAPWSGRRSQGPRWKGPRGLP